MASSRDSTNGRFTEDDCCVICQFPVDTTDGDESDRIVVAKCGHAFGAKCLTAWYLQLALVNKPLSCPLCRANLTRPCGHAWKFQSEDSPWPEIWKSATFDPYPDRCANCSGSAKAHGKRECIAMPITMKIMYLSDVDDLEDMEMPDGYIPYDELFFRTLVTIRRIEGKPKLTAAQEKKWKTSILQAHLPTMIADSHVVMDVKHIGKPEILRLLVGTDSEADLKSLAEDYWL